MCDDLCDLCQCLLKLKNILIDYGPPVICCADQISDILYLKENWDSFAHPALKVFSVLFVVANIIGCLIITLYFFNKKKFPTQIIQAFGDYRVLGYIFMVIIIGPCSILFTVVIWGKFHQIAKQCKCIAYLESKQFVKVETVATMAQLIGEDIPQFIIQQINNNLGASYGFVEVVSLMLSILAILIEVYKICCKNQGLKILTQVMDQHNNTNKNQNKSNLNISFSSMPTEHNSPLKNIQTNVSTFPIQLLLYPLPSDNIQRIPQRANNLPPLIQPPPPPPLYQGEQTQQFDTYGFPLKKFNTLFVSDRH